MTRSTDDLSIVSNAGQRLRLSAPVECRAGDWFEIAKDFSWAELVSPDGTRRRVALVPDEEVSWDV